MMTARSKRLFPRHSCNIPIQYRISGVDDYSEAVLYNSSRNGMYFEPQTMIRPGERIHIAMSTYVPSEEEPDKHCYYLATAVWCRSIPKDADPRFGCGASLIKGSCWLDGRDAKDICYLCDMCNAAIPCQDLQKTDEFLYLCPSCRQHLEKMPDGHLKRSIKRFRIGTCYSVRTQQDMVSVNKRNGRRMGPYRIVLADDHAMLREGIKGIINETRDLEVVGEASDGLALLQLLKEISADMVVLDVSMPKLRGIEAAREIKRQYPEVKILFLSMYKKKEYLRLAVAAGAEGYLLKEDTGFELIHAIDTIRHGRTYLSSFILKEAPEDLIGICRGNRKLGGDPLTMREREVLKLVGEGKTSKEIARMLFISPYTVNNHRKNIKRKLNIRKNADLIKYAIQHGYSVDSE